MKVLLIDWFVLRTSFLVTEMLEHEIDWNGKQRQGVFSQIQF
jgi:hypothetical protein